MRHSDVPQTPLAARLMAAAALLSLAACNGVPLGGGGGYAGNRNAVPPAPRTAASVQSTETAAMGAATPAPATDVAGAAVVAAGGKGRLGTTVASLGAAGEGGQWLKTPLVKKRTPGRVVNTETGKAVEVVLLPLAGSGSGSQASIGTMQALGAGLTDLPTVEVFAL